MPAPHDIDADSPAPKDDRVNEGLNLFFHRPVARSDGARDYNCDFAARQNAAPIPRACFHSPSIKAALRPELAALRRELDETTLLDRRALSRALDSLNAKPDDEKSLAAFRAKLQIGARKIRCARRAVPEIRVDETLPIAAKADEIVRLIREHQVVVLAGETGSGKTHAAAQAVPRGRARRRGHDRLHAAAPHRRARGGASRRRELGAEVGDLVGFQVRFTDQVRDAALIKFMTDGILLAETQSDPWLAATTRSSSTRRTSAASTSISCSATSSGCSPSAAISN